MVNTYGHSTLILSRDAVNFKDMPLYCIGNVLEAFGILVCLCYPAFQSLEAIQEMVLHLSSAVSQVLVVSKTQESISEDHCYTSIPRAGDVSPIEPQWSIKVRSSAILAEDKFFDFFLSYSGFVPSLVGIEHRNVTILFNLQQTLLSYLYSMLRE